MIDAYSKILETTKDTISQICFFIESDSEYVAIFSNKSKWKIILEADRYIHPAFDLTVARDLSSIDEQKYSIRILMKVFNDFRTPSLQNQLDFIINNTSKIMTEGEVAYKADYIKENEKY